MKQHIIWEWANREGLEHLQLSNFGAEGIKAEGLIVADTDAGIIHFRYSGYWESNWRVRRCAVIGPKRSSKSLLRLSRHDGGWLVDGGSRPDLDDCVALDIRDTPFTKIPLIQIAGLAVGEKCEKRVAYIDNRQWTVGAVIQTWQRLNDDAEYSHYLCTQDDKVHEFVISHDDGIVRFSKHRWRRVA